MKKIIVLASVMAALAAVGCGDDDDGNPCEGVPETDLCETAGDLQCSTDGTTVQSCAADANGCLVWTSTTTCGAHQTCVATGTTPVCECVDECAAGESECRGSVVWACETDPDGCLAFAEDVDCADTSESCVETGTTAECSSSCTPDCTTAGDTQCSDTVIQTCTDVGGGCLQWQDGTDCADTSEVCNDTAEPAVCEAGCTPDCDTAGDTQCSDTVIETCTDVDGCLLWQAGTDCADTDQVCNDTAEPAVCETACVPTCTTAGDTQCNTAGDAIETCTDVDGCLLWQETTDCTVDADYCDATGGTAACVSCTDTCTDGATQCNATVIETCTADAHGCFVVWTAGTDCATTSQECDDSTEPATCVDPMGTGSCADPIVVSVDHYALAGADFTADFTNDQTLGGTGCTARTGSIEAVFSIDLLAGETVLLREMGSLDAVLSLQNTCGDTEACVFSSDLGSDESGGLDYPATVDETVYLIVEAWYASPTSLAYDIRIDIVSAEDCGNGIDDDADGATDCDDMECLGVGTCPACVSTVVTTFPFEVSGTDFTADYTNTMVLDAASCVERTGTQADAIFEVALTAGQRLTLAETGTLDAVVSLSEAACGPAVTCVESHDSPETIAYTAATDITVTLFVEAYSASPYSTAYDITIDVVTAEICDNSLDDDGDGDTDCDDRECYGVGSCGIPGSCATPIVVTGDSYRVTGTNFSADWVHTMVLDAATCAERTGTQAEAVFEVALSAGETVQLAESGLVDVVVSMMQGGCSETQACVESHDSPETITYTATADTTVYLVVEAYSATTTSAYDITINVLSPPSLTINEVAYDDDGTDDKEFVELYYRGGGLSLDGYTLVHVNGSTGGPIWTAALDGHTVPADGFFVIGPSTTPNLDLDWSTFSATALQNSEEALVLYWHRGLADEEIIDAVAYVGTASLPAWAIETAPAAAIFGSEETSTGRYPDGADTDDNSADFGRAMFRTPGTANLRHDPAGFSRVSALSSAGSSSTYPVTIPDNTVPGPSAQINVTATFWPETLADLMVGVRISHGWIGDVELTLMSPDGTTIYLHDNTGGSADDIVTVYDAFTAVADTTLTMDDFAGENGRGVWTLTATDNSGGIAGEILEWYLLAN
ncbi:MAG: proprotein convertase P-domain-containing protein [Deltaproteobacteria bacterium]|nr:proprotein convertase P-domain-containing protein [Deltaproteobacteria bacterium]